MNEKDLVVLVADHNIEQALIGLFTRPEALGIRSIDVDISVHPQHDPGCATRGVEFLSNFSQHRTHRHAPFVERNPRPRRPIRCGVGRRDLRARRSSELLQRVL